MSKNISILGSTGSIGKQTIDICDQLDVSIKGLAANTNVDLMFQQTLKCKPELCALADEDKALELSKRFKEKGINCQVEYGVEGLKHVASLDSTDTCVSAIVGVAGLIPTLAAINSGKNIALANKETLVTAGELVMSSARQNDISIFPVDSEHSAILQCIQGNKKENINKIVLTASGGPFFGKNKAELESVSVEQALAHPTWKMGNKITIDSATLMNKGFEVIEAHWLFDMPVDKIEVVVHPQSVIHSMVEYVDGAILAQLGTPDMRLPIALALTYPDRVELDIPKLNLLELSKLTFKAPDMNIFKCLALAYEAIKIGGTMPAVVNGANEACVSLFLKGIISFNNIGDYIESAMDHYVVKNASLENVLEADRWAREFIGGNRWES